MDKLILINNVQQWVISAEFVIKSRNHFSKMCQLRKGQKNRHRKGIRSLDDYYSSSSDNTDYDSYSSDNTDYDYDSYGYEDISF